MSQPAARKGDMHQCPLTDGRKPHSGGRIEEGSDKVMIDKRPAATVGSACKCQSPAPNLIIAGSAHVMIGGQPAARVGDKTAHGGCIKDGSDKVNFG